MSGTSNTDSSAAQTAAIIRALSEDPLQYGISIYLSQKPPLLTSVDPNKIEELAGEKLNKDEDGAFNYIYGAAGLGLTHKANREAFSKWRIIPRMLIDATVRDLSTTIFGVKYPSPVILGPVGVQGIAHADAELATARAAAKLNIPFTLSTAATRTIEEVAVESGDGQRWYQLYWPKHDDVTLSLLQRAKKSGYTALIVTLDTNLLGWRPEDLKKAYLPFLHGVGCQIGLSDPVFMESVGAPISTAHPTFPYDPKELNKIIVTGGSAYSETLKQRMAISIRWMRDQINSGRFRSWDDVALLRNNWEGPLILKGIQSVHDAEKAIDVGANGIVVSNHGGRQVDGAIASLDALQSIMKSERVREAQKSGKLTIIFDSGIRTGPDIMKALALGAQAVMIARTYMYGLALEGQAGVEAVVKGLLSDLSISMGLSGYRNIEEVRSILRENMVREA